MRLPSRLSLLAFLVTGWIVLSAAAATAQVAPEVRLPPGESAMDWEEAFALAGVILASVGQPQVELIDAGDHWLLRVHAPDGLREVPVDPPTDATAREQIAILAMSLLMPGPAAPVATPAPAAAADPAPAQVEREPVIGPVDETADDGVTEVEAERVPVYLPALRQNGGSGGGENGQNDDLENERDEASSSKTAPPGRRGAVRARPPPTETTDEREPRPKRAKPAPRPVRSRRPTNATRAAPPPLSPFVVGASRLQVHRDHLPALHLTGGGGLLLTPQVRMELVFAGGFPTGLTLFDDDGVTRQMTSLGGRASLSWTPRPTISPLVRLSFGADVRRFSQDGVKVADVAVPVIEIGGGGSFSPTPGLRIEPLAELRLDLRQIPVDVGGAQEHDLLPISLLAGLSISIAPPPRTTDTVASAKKNKKD